MWLSFALQIMSLSYINLTHLITPVSDVIVNTLVTHHNHGGNDMFFHCQCCDKIYKSKGMLNRHMKFECNKEPSFYCMICSFKAKRKDSLKRHIALKH